MLHNLTVHIQNHLSAVTLVLLLGAIVVVSAFVVVRRRRALSRRGLPPLVFEVHDRPPANFRPAVFGAAPATSPPPQPAPPAPPPPSRVYAPPPISWTVAGSPPADGATTRMPRYARPPVDYLPGRLEIQSGGHCGEEIRFARNRGDTADITLGRDDGPPDSHVKLPAETVSRRHARMQYENGRWKITNLSRTNPTVVNGEELIAAGSGRWLEDGDTIEMGEIVLRFRTR